MFIGYVGACIHVNIDGSRLLDSHQSVLNKNVNFAGFKTLLLLDLSIWQNVMTCGW